jgi:hypothetical protein
MQLAARPPPVAARPKVCSLDDPTIDWMVTKRRACVNSSWKQPPPRRNESPDQVSLHGGMLWRYASRIPSSITGVSCTMAIWKRWSRVSLRIKYIASSPSHPLRCCAHLPLRMRSFEPLRQLYANARREKRPCGGCRTLRSLPIEDVTIEDPTSKNRKPHLYREIADAENQKPRGVVPR